jgi:hypothetical protein
MNEEKDNSKDVANLKSEEETATTEPAKENISGDKEPDATNIDSDNNHYQNANRKKKAETAVREKGKKKLAWLISPEKQDEKKTDKDFENFNNSSQESKYSTNDDFNDFNSKFVDYSRKEIEDFCCRSKEILNQLTSRLDQVCHRIIEIDDDLLEASRLSRLDERRLEKERGKLIREQDEANNRQLKTIGLIKEYEKEIKKRKIDEQSFNNNIDKTPTPSPASLFKDNMPVEKAVFYAATFFPFFSTSDFKKIVFSLLREQSIEEKAIQQIISKDGSQTIIEIPVRKNLANHLQENPYKIDRIWEECCLEVKTDNSLKYIDFSAPSLRDEFRDFFEKKQSSFMDEMIKNVEHLLFDNSIKISERAALVLAEAISYAPDEYNEGWFDKIFAIARKELDIIFLPGRIIDLLYKSQLKLVELGKIKNFLSKILSRCLKKDVDITFAIFVGLVHRNLCLNNEIDVIIFLLDWLREMLDIDIHEQDDTRIRSFAFWSLIDLFRTPSLSDTIPSDYIYNLLGALRQGNWLPASDLSVDSYETSHKIALAIPLIHSWETIERVEGSGEYNDYPLFMSLGENDKSDLFKVRLLIYWLLYYLKNESKINSPEEISDQLSIVLQFFEIQIDDPFRLTAYILVEWISILLNFVNENGIEKRSKLANILLREVVEAMTKSEQRKLCTIWTEYSDACLRKAEEFDNEGEVTNKKYVLAKRRSIKEVKKRFKEQQNLKSQGV